MKKLRSQRRSSLSMFIEVFSEPSLTRFDLSWFESYSWSGVIFDCAGNGIGR